MHGRGQGATLLCRRYVPEAGQKSRDVNLLPGRRSMALVVGHDLLVGSPAFIRGWKVAFKPPGDGTLIYLWARCPRARKPILSRQMPNALIGKRIHVGAVHWGRVSSTQQARYFFVSRRCFSDFHIVDSSTWGHDTGNLKTVNCFGGDNVTSGLGKCLTCDECARASGHRIHAGQCRRLCHSRTERLRTRNLFRRHRGWRRVIIDVLESGNDDSIFREGP